MSAAFAALVAALSVVFALAVNTTTTPPIETYLNVLLEFVRGDSLRRLSPEEVLSVLFYVSTLYLIVFSVAWWLFRLLAVFLVAFGLPNEEALRLNREVRRGRGAHIDLARRQARFTAAYLLRAQELAAARQERASRRADSSEPTLEDFNL
ncbi:MAG: hypothetical protein CUN51_03755 [Candidatus Thermofonsia Clade 1 bacterium]|uniref:Uncharacterized protein n=1 Tax=Candidatus Thermofonsia Clade 1 bacterium TaxID=2364210 RepID=A0A2M8P1M5_9CHLR|nr:MAG: hypothetical protein CUN51_03755 [Candidatus Thermofonsia Clade 1 bacterium]